MLFQRATGAPGSEQSARLSKTIIYNFEQARQTEFLFIFFTYVLTVDIYQNDQYKKGSFVHYEKFPSDNVSTRPVDIWLPEGYFENADRHYPVIYLHDGQGMFNKETGEAFYEFRERINNLGEEKIGTIKKEINYNLKNKLQIEESLIFKEEQE